MTNWRVWLAVSGVAILIVVIATGAWLWTPDKSRAELEATYLASPTDYLDVAGVRLHVRDSGSRTAPGVILLHGFGSSLHTWEPWAQALSTTHRVIRYDSPGFGLTGPDPSRDYSQERGVQVLSALMDKLGLGRASIVGHSMGGRLAWNFAARQPTRVANLVLVAPDGFASPGFEYGKPTTVPTVMKLMKYALPKSLLRMNLAPAYGDSSRLSDATVTRYYDLMLAPQVRGAIIDRMEQVALVPPEPLLQQIKAPTLLLWGEKDGMIPVTNAQDYLRVLPSATFVSLPGLGHVPHEEAPAASLPPVRAFLDK